MSMPEHDTTTPFGNPDGPTDTVAAERSSIVDDMLKLDDFLSGEVRRAEKTCRFALRPELEAQIEDLSAELDRLTDIQGRPLPVIDRTLDEGGRSALVVNSEILELQRQYHEAMAVVRVRAMDEDDWTAFQQRHKATLNSGELPYPEDLYADLILSSEATVTMPGGRPEQLTAEQLRRLRKVLGHAAFSEISSTAWQVNTASGVSVPKSLLSSAVLRQQTPG